MRLTSLRISAALLVPPLAAAPSRAADYFWNPGVGTGSTNWAFNANWSTPTNGPNYASNWANDNTANFTAADQTITANSLISIAGINFTANNIQVAAGSGDLRLTGSVPVSVSGANTATIAEDLVSIGAGVALVKQGTGTLVLSGANNMTTVNVSAGTLRLGSSTALGSISSSPALVVDGTLDLAGFSATRGALSGSGTVTNSSASTTSTLTVGTGATGTTTFGGVIQNGVGTVALTKTGTGTLTLSGSNTYTGATTINGGTLAVSTLANGGTASGIGAGGSAAGNLVLDGGTLRYTGVGSVVTDRAFTLSAGGGTIDVQTGATTLVISGGGTGAGGLTKAGAGTLSLTGASNYTGGTTISAGTLRIGNGGAGGSVTGDITNNATLQFNKSSTETVANSITGTGALSLVGTGTLTFTGANGYTGTTALGSAVKAYVAAGATLAAGGAGAVTVGGAATLGGEGAVGGSSVTYQTATTLDVGDGAANDIGTLTFSNALDFQAGAATTFQFNRSAGNAAGTGFDRVNAGGAIALGGSFTAVIADNTGSNPFTTMTVFSGASRTGTFSNLTQGAFVPGLAGFGGHSQWVIDYTATGVDLVPVPEPGAVLGMAAAGLGLARWVRRRRG